VTWFLATVVTVIGTVLGGVLGAVLGTRRGRKIGSIEAQGKAAMREIERRDMVAGAVEQAIAESRTAIVEREERSKTDEPNSATYTGEPDWIRRLRATDPHRRK
jgi:uncharacterized protein YcfJ